jgi:hypothetical protein
LDLLYIDLLRREDSHRTEDIGYVELSLETRCDMKMIGRELDIKLDTIDPMGDIFGTDLSRWSKSYGDHIVDDDILGEKSTSILAIDIYHSYFPDLFADTILVEIFEKEHLGLDIVVHRLVEIEMILGDIGEDRSVIAESMDTVVVERVTRGLDHGMRTSSFFGLIEELPEDKRTWGGHLEVVITQLAIDHHINRRKHSHFFPRSLEPIGDDIGSGGFSLCTRDADHCHITSRIAR